MSLTYKDSGVDVEGGNRFVKKITPFVRSTFTPGVITDIGGFGALFSPDFSGMEEPVLVSGTDGVGTKLRIAQKMNKHDTIGIDAVAMCVNDIITSGAKPLFFLDYISCGRLKEDVLVDVVKGIAEGCIMSSCSLVGGETAEHPGVVPDDEYDIAGFSVGIVDRKKIIDGNTIGSGDIIIGIASSGIHSNGYSLVRKLFLEMKGYSLDKKFNDLEKTLGETLLVPTTIYVKGIKSSMESGINPKGIVHITGGGFYENIPRILPQNTSVVIEKKSFPVPPIFNIIKKEGSVNEAEMFTTFNMGIGMMIFVDKSQGDAALKVLDKAGYPSYIIGEVIPYKDERVQIL
ncbi:MAG: phosphoribosylformylglycinamidine cyclo-ligase [Spirochaetota bacterium]